MAIQSLLKIECYNSQSVIQTCLGWETKMRETRRRWSGVRGVGLWILLIG